MFIYDHNKAVNLDNGLSLFVEGASIVVEKEERRTEFKYKDFDTADGMFYTLCETLRERKEAFCMGFAEINAMLYGSSEQYGGYLIPPNELPRG